MHSADPMSGRFTRLQSRLNCPAKMHALNERGSGWGGHDLAPGTHAGLTWDWVYFGAELQDFCTSGLCS